MTDDAYPGLIILVVSYYFRHVSGGGIESGQLLYCHLV